MKPDWYGVRILLTCKGLHTCVKMHFSKALSMLLSKDICLYVEGKAVLSYLGIGLT